jgi:8-hydroxy-5-deazaflavin:NADPH oxidoreductase
MRYAVLGTGMVGAALASRLVELGHEVTMGARDAGNAKAVAWASSAGRGAAEGSFAGAARFGEVVVNATAGAHSLHALRAAGADNLRGKVLVDVANAMEPDSGFPPRLIVCNGDSLGEQIQREFPGARVVKTLNTVNCDVMVNPAIVPGVHNVYVCGNDDNAKAVVVDMLRSFGWSADAVLDMGDITAARGMEMYLLFWISLMQRLGTAHFNIAVHRE